MHAIGIVMRLPVGIMRGIRKLSSSDCTSDGLTVTVSDRYKVNMHMLWLIFKYEDKSV